MAIEPSTVSTAAARRFLEQHLPEAVSGVVPLAGGTWSQAFAFRAGELDLVVRFGTHVGDYRKDRRASAWRSPELPIPEVVEIGEAFDAHFAISTRAHGEPLESVRPAQWATLVPHVLELVEHCVAVPVARDGYGRWGPDGVAPHVDWPAFLLSVANDDPTSRIHGWTRRLAQHPDADATFARGLNALERCAADLLVPAHLVHADLTNRNVLVDGGAISAVFDWGSSLYGDPLYDVAWIGFWSPWHPNLAAVDIVEAARAHSVGGSLGGADDFDRRVAACQLHIGLDHLAYNAFAGRGDDLRQVAQAVEAISDRWAG